LSAHESAGAVVEICRRLDGIPLAIELAASRMLSMTVTELRDRLDDRFRLLVGSRRGLERHQTLRHAVQWSYELLDDTEKGILNRCSVFAGGFDLASACAVTGADDEFTTLDLLDALVRKSLLVADRSTNRTRFSMLETIRQFAEQQLVASGESEELRAAHARYFAGREADVLALWDSPRQREAYEWFMLELANLRTAFRWAADHDDLDSAVAIAVFASTLGSWVEQFEPGAWAEDIIEPARRVEHRRLAQLYVMASRSGVTGRLDVATMYAEEGLRAINSGRFDAVPFGFAYELGGVYITKGDPSRWIEMCRNAIAEGADGHTLARAYMVITLVMVGEEEEAVAASEVLRAADSGIENPALVCWALLAYGFARHRIDPTAAYEVHRRGVEIAQASGNRLLETYHIGNLSRLAALHGDPIEAFDFIGQTIANYFDSGNFSLMPQPLAVLAAYLDRLGYHEPAATISGFATTPFARNYYPEFNSAIAHLCDVLGNGAYESFARTGRQMTNSAMANYALERMDQARSDLVQAGEPR
jgi:hypothetical protein